MAATRNGAQPSNPPRLDELRRVIDAAAGMGEGDVGEEVLTAHPS